MTTDSETHESTTRKVPFIPGYPFLGNVPQFAHDRLQLFQRMARKNDVCGLHFGPFASILFNKPEHVQSILVEHASDFDKGDAIHNAFRPVAGDGIFSSEGDFHRHQRKLISPPFQPRHIARYADIIGQYTEQAQQTWADGAVIDLNMQITTLTMGIIGKALFDADGLTEADELGTAISIILEYLSRYLSQLFPLPYHWPLPRHQRTHAAVRVVRRYLQRHIDERRSHPTTERDDFLSILLQARDETGHSMSDEQVMTECMTLFVAGHDTIATALCWTWYLLSQHPQHYQQVQEEVDRVLQGRTPTSADLAHLPYCLQVFKEALRLYPAAYLLIRRALRDIEIDGYLVQKDSAIFISPYTLHRREEYFPDPEKFDPERFSPEREKLLPRYAFLPFGAGARICLGQHFAMLEGHLLLATIAQRVSFSLLPGQNIKPDPLHHLTLRPVGAITVRVKRHN